MKNSVEKKAELAKRKIDKRLQKQKQKFEKAAAKKEAEKAKKEERFELAEQKRAARQEVAEQKKAAKKEIADMKKQVKQEAAKQKAAAKKQAQMEKAAAKKQSSKKQSSKKQSSKKSKSSAKEKTPKAGNKKLLAGILALVFVGGGVGGFLFFRGGAEEESDPYVEAYGLDDDVVESIAGFLGESETRALPEITEVEEGESKEIVYHYTELTDASEEVKSYVNYLTEEKGFVPMFEYNLNHPGGYVSIATASQEAGKIFKMDIDYTNTDYKVIVTKTDEALPEPEPEQTQTAEASREGALSHLGALPIEELGLSKPVGEYTAIYDPGRSLINSSECYGINLYELGPAGTNVAVGKFFVSTDMNNVYKYSPLEDSYMQIENTTTEAEAAKAAAEAVAQQETTENTQENTTDAQQTDTTEQSTDLNGKRPAKETTTQAT